MLVRLDPVGLDYLRMHGEWACKHLHSGGCQYQAYRGYIITFGGEPRKYPRIQ